MMARACAVCVVAFAALVAVLAAPAAIAGAADARLEFDAWAARYGRSYSTPDEREARFAVFRSNRDFIARTNAKRLDKWSMTRAFFRFVHDLNLLFISCLFYDLFPISLRSRHEQVRRLEQPAV